ncbi:MAG TPA: NAD-dependent epimerase/dehydratase family protein [Nevskiales bacterium]|nr:NAD-dependent epimerase/dehydratase family protein [Nevskiales bacterium]
MNVIVTGGSGFIGSRLVRRLQASGDQVRIVDLVVQPEFESCTTRADVADPAAMTQALAGADLVYHLAAEHRDDVRPAERYYRTNVDGMRALCAAASRHGIRRIVFTSTVAVYGLATLDVTEDAQPNPENHYGRSKLAAEEVLRAWRAEDPARRIAIIRPCVVFGAGNRGNVHTLLEQIISGRFLMVGDGGNRKSIAYVDNVVDALLFLAGLEGDALVNYADKPDLSMHELIGIICAASGTRIPHLRLPLWMGMGAGRLLDLLARARARPYPISAVRIRKFVSESVVNADRLRALGFAPRHALADGLALTIRQDFGATTESTSW